MHTNINVPFISPVLAVEYFFICSKLSFPVGISPVLRAATSAARMVAEVGRACCQFRCDDLHRTSGP